MPKPENHKDKYHLRIITVIILGMVLESFTEHLKIKYLGKGSEYLFAATAESLVQKFMES